MGELRPVWGATILVQPTFQVGVGKKWMRTRKTIIIIPAGRVTLLGLTHYRVSFNLEFAVPGRCGQPEGI